MSNVAALRAAVVQAAKDIREFVASNPDGVDLDGIRDLNRVVEELDRAATGSVRQIENAINFAEDRLADFLCDHTDEVFEEIPEIDGARANLQDAWQDHG